MRLDPIKNFPSSALGSKCCDLESGRFLTGMSVRLNLFNVSSRPDKVAVGPGSHLENIKL